MKVLIAVGEKHLSQIIRGNLVDEGFEVTKEDVLHRAFLDETINLERPGLLILHDKLPSEQIDAESNEQELLQMIEHWRRAYDTQMRVVVMCERERRDPFLSQLVARNVLDIFNERQIPTSSFIGQLKEPPKYMNVSRYGVAESDIDSLMEDTEEKEEEVEPQTREEAKSPSFLKKQLPKLPKVPHIQAPRFQVTVHKHLEEQKEIALQERKIILVVSPFERCGSTFIAHQLAYSIAKEGFGVRYFENPFKNPYTYDRFAGHTNAKDYFSVYSEIPDYDENEYVREWFKDGVGIQALNPVLEKRLEEEQFPISRFLRQLLSVHDSPYLIVDIGSDSSKAIYDELIEVASHVLVVVDSDIPRLELFEHYQLSEQFGWIHNVLLQDKAHLVANRYVKGIESALPTDEYIAIHSFDDEWVYGAQAKGTFSFPSREAQKAQKDGFKKLYSLVVDKKAKKQRKSSVKRVKNWLPRLEIAKDREKLEESK